MAKARKPKREITEAGDNVIASWAADLLDLEQQINDLQDGKRDLYTSIREDHGRVLADAVKNAVRLSRMDDEKRERVEATDTETERVLRIIASPRAPAPHVRAREIIEQFPAQNSGGQESGDRAPSLSNNHPGGENANSVGKADASHASTHPEAKATVGNAATVEPLEETGKTTAGRESQVGGAEPRASAATSELRDVTAGETAPNSEAHSSAPALERALHHSRTDAAAERHPSDDEGQGVRGAGVAANSETREGEAGAMPVMAGEPAGEGSGRITSPVVARADGCLNPSVCASSSWRHRCHGCEKAWKAAHPEGVAA